MSVLSFAPRAVFGGAQKVSVCAPCGEVGLRGIRMIDGTCPRCGGKDQVELWTGDRLPEYEMLEGGQKFPAVRIFTTDREAEDMEKLESKSGVTRRRVEKDDGNEQAGSSGNGAPASAAANALLSLTKNVASRKKGEDRQPDSRAGAGMDAEMTYLASFDAEATRFDSRVPRYKLPKQMYKTLPNDLTAALRAKGYEPEKYRSFDEWWDVIKIAWPSADSKESETFWSVLKPLLRNSALATATTAQEDADLGLQRDTEMLLRVLDKCTPNPFANGEARREWLRDRIRMSILKEGKTKAVGGDLARIYKEARESDANAGGPGAGQASGPNLERRSSAKTPLPAEPQTSERKAARDAPDGNEAANLGGPAAEGETIDLTGDKEVDERAEETRKRKGKQTAVIPSLTFPKKFTLVNNSADGNCLFESFGQILFKPSDRKTDGEELWEHAAPRLRELACDYMQAVSEGKILKEDCDWMMRGGERFPYGDFANLYKELKELDEKGELSQYISEMRKTADGVGSMEQYGEVKEINALTGALQLQDFLWGTDEILKSALASAPEKWSSCWILHFKRGGRSKVIQTAGEHQSNHWALVKNPKFDRLDANVDEWRSGEMRLLAAEDRVRNILKRTPVSKGLRFTGQ
jgi:Zn ribbon nucleic-acid-binding protein